LHLSVHAKLQFLTYKEAVASISKTSRLMLLGETISVHSENKSKYINILCGQNAEFLTLQQVVA
jgi:hypothetical protein